MNPEIVIRRMTASDLDRVLHLAEDLPQAPHWPRSAYLNALNSQIDTESTPRRIALVVCAASAAPQSGSIHGFAIVSLLPPQAELETIAVAPETQRQGLGWHLFEALATKLKATGVDELLLEVRASNRPALAFYQALGFAKIGLRPGYYADPIDDAVLLSLQLIAKPSSTPADPA